MLPEKWGSDGILVPGWKKSQSWAGVGRAGVEGVCREPVGREIEGKGGGEREGEGKVWQCGRDCVGRVP